MPKTHALSLKQLHAIEETLRAKSYTEAARQLGVSQPTVSNLVLSAEKQFGCRLIARENGELSPTSHYRAIRARVIAMLALSEEIEAALAGHRDLSEAKLRIGYSTYQVAMPFIARYARHYPGVDLTARALASHDLLPLLQTGALDIGFVTARECPPDLDGELISATRIGVVVPDDHPLAGKAQLDWSDLKGHKLIQREPSAATRRLFEAAAGIANATPETILGLGSWGSIASLVCDGIGLGVALDVECQQEPGLLFKPINDPNLRASQYLVCLPAMRHTAPLRAFFNLASTSGEGAPVSTS